MIHILLTLQSITKLGFSKYIVKLVLDFVVASGKCLKGIGLFDRIEMRVPKIQKHKCPETATLYIDVTGETERRFGKLLLLEARHGKYFNKGKKDFNALNEMKAKLSFYKPKSY